MRRALLAGAAIAALSAGTAAAQGVSTAVVPETITVGDVFHAAVRVEVPAGAVAEFPDTLQLQNPEVEAAGRVRVTIDSTAAPHVATAIYPLTAWRAGAELALPDVAVTIREGNAGQVVNAAFPAFTLRSVLPADTAGIDPKPAKDVWGANRLWWPWLVAAGVLLVLLGLAYWLWRRRRPRASVEVVVPAASPREAALARLDALRASGMVERGEMRPFYFELTAALRAYLEAVDSELGADLTTSELAAHARRRSAPPALLELLRLLGSADLVKFARAHPAPQGAYGDHAAARRWVERYDGPQAATDAADDAGRAA